MRSHVEVSEGNARRTCPRTRHAASRVLASLSVHRHASARGTMRTASPQSVRAGERSDRPEDDQVDLCGVTHVGRMRKDNQDQFLVCTVHPQLVIHGTSLPNPELLPTRGTRFGTVMLVADGVGGAVDGSAASRLAAETVMRYVTCDE